MANVALLLHVASRNCETVELTRTTSPRHGAFMRIRVRAVSLVSLAIAAFGCGSSDQWPGSQAGSGGGGSVGEGGNGGTGTGGGSGGVDGGNDGSRDPNLPPIDPNLLVSDLTDVQRAQLCDWASSQFGGYGVVTTCPDGRTISGDKDQATCVAQGFKYRCPVTVGEVETCTLAEVPSKGCDFPFDQCHALVCQ